jgi:hypothetical protein
MLFVPENKLPDSDDDVCESLAVTKQPFVFTLLPRVLVWAAFDTHTHKRWVCGPSAKKISLAEHREMMSFCLFLPCFALALSATHSFHLIGLHVEQLHHNSSTKYMTPVSKYPHT